MKKIPSVFCRNYEGDRLCRNEVVPGCEWVLAGEGIATRKWDGTACLVRYGRLYKRYDAKHGKQPPPGFEPAQEADPTTGHWPGWLPVGDGAEDRWHREAWVGASAARSDGTYELVGPKVQGNAQGFEHHLLILHGHEDDVLSDVPRTFNGLRDYLAARRIEGIVFYHPDGRMAKVKRTDFGFAWGSKGARR